MPKVSIIIPAYNCAKYLRDTLDSALNQTYRDFELVIVNDGSTDNTDDIIKGYHKKYPDKIRYFYQDNKGVSATRNKGIELANGEYIAFLDSDDIWLPSKLEKQIQTFENYKNVGLVFSKAYQIDNDNSVIGYKGVDIKEVNLRGLLFDRNFIITSTVIMRKEILKKLGSFNPQYSIGEDYDMWLRVATIFRILYIDIPLVKYRDSYHGLSKNVEMVHRNHIEIFKSYLSYSPYLIKKISKECYLLGKFYYTKHLYVKGAIYIQKALTYHFLVGHLFWDKNDSIVNKIYKLLKPYILLLLNIILSPCAIFSKQRDEKITPTILFYESSSGFGGSANDLANLINNLSKNKYRPIVAFNNYGPRIDKIENAEIVKLKNYSELESMSFINFLFFFIKNIIPEAIRFYFIIKTKKVCLLHINTNILLGVSAIIASRIASIPCITHIRQTRKPIKREIFFARWLSKIIVLNKDAYELYKQYIPENKLTIVYAGIELDDFKRIEAGNFRKGIASDGSPLIGVIARIVQGKGQKEFILAAKEVIKIKPEVKFVIVGDAKGGDSRYFCEIKELVEKEKLANNIMFTGWRNSVKNIISDLDILIHPGTSFPEGLPNIILEAMALGKPVIATNIPGSRDLVINNKTGILVSPGDTKEMSAKIISLLENSQDSKEMCKEAKKRLELLFDAKKQVKKIEKIYEDILAGGA